MPKIKRTQKTKRIEKIELATVGLMLALGIYLAAPTVADAILDLGPRLRTGAELALEIDAMQNGTRPFGELPEAEDGSPTKILTLPVTAYSSDVWQTDATPTVTASGTSVRHGVIAANFLPIGTRVKLPELFGDEVFIVEDRMNRRYRRHMDVWMEETADAENFGLQWTTVEVF